MACSRILFAICRSQESLINMTPDLASLLKSIWSDVGIQMCAARSHEYKLFDSATYFLHDLDRITHPDYFPTFKDILRCRIQTSGVVEMTYGFKVRFVFKKLTFLSKLLKTLLFRGKGGNLCFLLNTRSLPAITTLVKHCLLPYLLSDSNSRICSASAGRAWQKLAVS